MDNFRKVDPPCGRPDAKWWKRDCCPPSFKSVHKGEFKVVAVDQLVNENDEGQKLNPARSQGIDWKNVAAISDSFLVKGFNTMLMPPIVLSDGTVIDGNNRVEALRQAGFEFACVYEVKIKDGKDIEDVFDEVGLGMNNHLSSKPVTLKDCKVRLRKYFERKGKYDLESGIEWFSTFDHPFSEKKVQDAVDKVISNVRESKTMSPFRANTVIDLLKRKGKDTDVRVFNYKKGWDDPRNSTYLLRTLYDSLKDYQGAGGGAKATKPMVAFLSGFDAKEVAKARKDAEKQIKEMNGLLNAASVLIAAEVMKGNNPQLLKLEEWTPQITNEETDFIPPEDTED
tara:strand:+ start:278 stop:1297 length:1020 start_codon:yes stop_codon:yes gene_type:complete